MSKYIKYMNTHIWEVVSVLEKLFLFNISKYLKYMNTRIWKVFFILIKNIFILVDHVLNTSNTWICVFGRYSLFWSKIFLFNMSKYLKYMNTRIWKVFFYFNQKYTYFGWPCQNTSNTWIRVFGRYSFFLIKNIFILVDHVLNTSNTWIRVFER